MSYGNAIRKVRAARGLSQRKLGELASFNASFISLLEAGKRKPSIETIEVLAHVMDVPAYLLVLIASKKRDLRGISQREARVLGEHVLRLFIEPPRRRQLGDSRSASRS
jgi:transcriptional regulator with XRE-family HTH domain